jgi:hypothetical protein
MFKKILREFKKGSLQMLGSDYPVALSRIFEWNSKFKNESVMTFYEARDSCNDSD